MRMGIGVDMLLIMALSVIAIDCSAAQNVRKDQLDNNASMCAEKQLKDLQIAYGLDNAAMPASLGKGQSASSR